VGMHHRYCLQSYHEGIPYIPRTLLGCSGSTQCCVLGLALDPEGTRAVGSAGSVINCDCVGNQRPSATYPRRGFSRSITAHSSDFACRPTNTHGCHASYYTNPPNPLPPRVALTFSSMRHFPPGCQVTSSRSDATTGADDD